MVGLRGAAGLTRIVLGLFLLFALCALPDRPAAHGVTPTVADFRVEKGQLFLELRINVEAFVAGVELDGLADTRESNVSERYETLRGMAAAQLEPRVREFFPEWIKGIQAEAGGPLDLSYEGVRIPVVGSTDAPRKSVMLLTADLPPGARSLRLTWPVGAGALVLRQQGVQAPYTGYLRGGEISPPIPLAGGASLGPWETFEAYVPTGFEQILPRGTEQILFMLGIFFLSHRTRPLVQQFATLSLGVAVGMAAKTLALVEVPAGIVPPMVAASIVLIAAENVFFRRLHPWRLILVLLFGIFHGLALAHVLDGIGLPPVQLLSAMGGYYLGIELGLLAVVVVAYLATALWFRRKPWYRGRIAIPASLVIALVGGYLLAQPYLSV
ncbi:HupE/UreJ family protein [Ruegeria sediminis]|uniref:HupE/UreJ family protein n=1 Tax=Ruegeria sediminis TaxID=2583820 RepID=A0ABY2X050_9RHOB|nr:HupE/UreJ family protein [Ruegeria sediminis]TMV08620.1 HupE/UreJ family protein [Ruegeria sediminis]